MNKSIVFFRWACIDDRKFVWYGNEGADLGGERRWQIPLLPLVLADDHCHEVMAKWRTSPTSPVRFGIFT